MTRIPELWIYEAISTIVDSLDAGTSVNAEDRPKEKGEVGVLKVSAVTYGRFDPCAYKTVLPPEVDRLTITPQKDTILVSRANTAELVGASAYIDQDYPDLFLPDKLWRISISRGYSARWLSYVISSSIVRSRISDRATGTSGSMKNVSQQAFLSIPILIPPLPEQRKIAEILSTWDEAIYLVQALISALKSRKQGLMQRLLTGEVRFPGFDEPWMEVRLGDHLMESRVIGSNGEIAKKLTVKLYGKGVQEKQEHRLGSESTQYYIRSSGQFIYSKLDFLNGAFGIVPSELDGYETTLDLPSFDISETLNPVFLLNYIAREDFYKQQLGLARGGRKARRVPPSEIEKIRVAFPSISEQASIATCINDVESEIATVERYLKALREQKKGLMQRLLTGEVRVSV